MASQAKTSEQQPLPNVDLKPLLAKMWPMNATVTADEIADAIAHFFTNQVSEAQTASLLMALHFTKLDFQAEVLAKCAAAMRKAAVPIPVDELRAIIDKRGNKEGDYHGGLVSGRLSFGSIALIYFKSSHYSIHFGTLLLLSLFVAIARFPIPS
jgi:anthranilate phosphoribosyltransferase